MIKIEEFEDECIIKIHTEGSEIDLSWQVLIF